MGVFLLVHPFHFVLSLLVHGLSTAVHGLLFAWLWLRTERPPKQVLVAQRQFMAQESRHSAQIRTLSIIIPVMDEIDVIERCLLAIAQHAADKDRIEVIVVDAGCTDGTMARVASVSEELTRRSQAELDGSPSSFIIHTIESRGGRGPALNAGLLEATGEVIMMLHAGTALPAGYDERVVHALMNPEILVAAFSFRIEPAHLDDAHWPIGLSAWEWATHVRSSWLRLPLGEQALALRSRTLASVGGLPSVAMFEDYELVHRLRRASLAGGGRVITLPAHVSCLPGASMRVGGRSAAWRHGWRKLVGFVRYASGATAEEVFHSYHGVAPPGAELSAREVLIEDVRRVLTLRRRVFSRGHPHHENGHRHHDANSQHHDTGQNHATGQHHATDGEHHANGQHSQHHGHNGQTSGSVNSPRSVQSPMPTQNRSPESSAQQQRVRALEAEIAILREHARVPSIARGRQERASREPLDPSLRLSRPPTVPQTPLMSVLPESVLPESVLPESVLRVAVEAEAVGTHGSPKETSGDASPASWPSLPASPALLPLSWPSYPASPALLPNSSLHTSMGSSLFSTVASARQQAVHGASSVPQPQRNSPVIARPPPGYARPPPGSSRPFYTPAGNQTSYSPTSYSPTSYSPTSYSPTSYSPAGSRALYSPAGSHPPYSPTRSPAGGRLSSYSPASYTPPDLPSCSPACTTPTQIRRTLDRSPLCTSRFVAPPASPTPSPLCASRFVAPPASPTPSPQMGRAIGMSRVPSDASIYLSALATPTSPLSPQMMRQGGSPYTPR